MLGHISSNQFLNERNEPGVHDGQLVKSKSESESSRKELADVQRTVTS